MIPRLLDDPAWRRYDWELRHLPIVVFRQDMREQARLFGQAIKPAIDRANAAMSQLARSIADDPNLQHSIKSAAAAGRFRT